MTDKKTESLKLALKKAFDLGQMYCSWADSEYSSHWEKADAAKEQFNQLVEDTIREALAEQPAQQQEPVVTKLIKAKQNFERKFGPHAMADWIYSDLLECLDDTSPPASKPWVGLTKEERVDFTLGCGSYETVCAIEAKLKEKNCE